VGTNAKRGFNRLFLVLTIGWALFWAVAYPLWRQNEGQLDSFTKHDEDYKLCAENPEQRDCYKQADERFKAAQEFYSLRKFWWFPVALWRLVIPLIILPPLFVYGLGALVVWIWRGFHTIPG